MAVPEGQGPASGGPLEDLLEAARSRDPATAGVSPVGIVAGWPGVQAVLVHRLAHSLFRSGRRGLAGTLAYLNRMVTGIEIHPGARIGRGLFIDHGSGVVIGETAELGDNVTIYQGVTLGGTGFQTGKRHPSVGDNVTVGSGAKLLGPIEVGHDAKIGANTVVVEDVPPHSTVVGNPGHPVKVEGRKVDGPDADWIHLPDPLQEAVKKLSDRIDQLEKKIGTKGGSDRQSEGDQKPGEPRRGRSSAGG
jgi:serine O-acetyltransferase